MISVVIFSAVQSLFHVSVKLIASTVVVALSHVTGVASSSFSVPRDNILRTPFACVIVYAHISQTLPIVRTLPLRENHFCAAAVAWIFKNFASVTPEVHASNVITNLSASTLQESLSSL